MSSAVASTKLSLNGLASGMDTDTIIKKLMSIEQTKVDGEKQKKQILEWKKDSYRDINTKLLAVRNSLLDLKLPSTYNGKTVTSSDEDTMTATATGDAIPGIYTMKVKQVAQRVSLSSTVAMGSTGDKSSIAKQFGLADTDQIKFTLKGKDGEIAFDFAAKDATMQQIVDGINNQNTGMHAYYDQGIDRFFLMTSDFGSDAEISVKVDGINGTGSFLKDKLKLKLTDSTLNDGSPLNSHKITSTDSVAATPPADSALMSSFYAGTTVPSAITFTLQGTGKYDFSFNSSTSLATMVSDINAQIATTGITAAYDASTGKLSLASDPVTNPGGQVAIRADANEFLSDKMKLNMSYNAGTSAKIDFNDATDLEFDSNNFTLNNINFKLSPNAEVGTSATLTIANDTETAVTKIKAFVEAYNTVVTQLSTKLSESRTIEDHAVKYMPLTDTQKEAMSEDQITQWETNAKTGLMKNEDILQSALSNIRSAVSGILQDKAADANVADKSELVDYVNSSGQLVTNYQYKSLAAIGITTGQYASGSNDNGKLYIDETKLRAALESNADDVEKLFTLTQTDTTATTTQTIDGEEYARTLNYSIGIAAKLYDTLTDSINQIVNKAGSESSYYDNSLLAQDINQEDTHISDMLDRMQDMEDRYYTQFSAMETAMQKLNSQGEWLQQKMATSSS